MSHPSRMRLDCDPLMRHLPRRRAVRTIMQRCRRLSTANLDRLIASETPARLKRGLRGKLLSIPLQRITSEYAFSLAPRGWNYLRALLAERVHHPHTPLEETAFFQFFQHSRIRAVRDLDDVLSLHQSPADPSPDDFRFAFGTYPWGHWMDQPSLIGGRPWGHHYDDTHGTCTRDLHGYRRNPWYRPGDTYPLKTEYEEIYGLYNSMAKRYRPIWYGAFPTVVLMVRRNGAWCAVRDNGHHRLSILSYLGHDQATVAIPYESVGVVHEDEVEQWYYVKHGWCTTRHALRIFQAYFELDGRERIRHLGLPSIY